MRRALALLAPLSLFLLACGGDDDAAARLTTTTVDRDRDRDERDRDDRDDDSAPAAPPAGGDPTSAYCNLAREFQDAGDQLDEAFDSFDFSPDLFREAFEFAGRAIGEIQRIAPPELRSDYATVGEALGTIRAALEEVDYNFFAVDFEVFLELGEELDAASARIEDYNERVCGIPPSGDFDDFDDLDDFDFDDLDFDLGDLEDLFGEFDLDSLGEFGELIRQQLVTEFMSEGYSRSDAECLAEAIFDLDFDFTSSDPSEFVDPYTKCGVDP